MADRSPHQSARPAAPHFPFPEHLLNGDSTTTATTTSASTTTTSIATSSGVAAAAPSNRGEANVGAPLGGVASQGSSTSVLQQPSTQLHHAAARHPASSTSLGTSGFEGLMKYSPSPPPPPSSSHVTSAPAALGGGGLGGVGATKSDGPSPHGALRLQHHAASALVASSAASPSPATTRGEQFVVPQLQKQQQQQQQQQHSALPKGDEGASPAPIPPTGSRKEGDVAPRHDASHDRSSSQLQQQQQQPQQRYHQQQQIVGVITPQSSRPAPLEPRLVGPDNSGGDGGTGVGGPFRDDSCSGSGLLVPKTTNSGSDGELKPEFTPNIAGRQRNFVDGSGSGSGVAPLPPSCAIPVDSLPNNPNIGVSPTRSAEHESMGQWVLPSFALTSANRGGGGGGGGIGTGDAQLFVSRNTAVNGANRNHTPVRFNDDSSPSNSSPHLHADLAAAAGAVGSAVSPAGHNPAAAAAAAGATGAGGTQHHHHHHGRPFARPGLSMSIENIRAPPGPDMSISMAVHVNHQSLFLDEHLGMSGAAGDDDDDDEGDDGEREEERGEARNGSKNLGRNPVTNLEEAGTSETSTSAHSSSQQQQHQQQHHRQQHYHHLELSETVLAAFNTHVRPLSPAERLEVVGYFAEQQWREHMEREQRHRATDLMRSFVACGADVGDVSGNGKEKLETDS